MNPWIALVLLLAAVLVPAVPAAAGDAYRLDACEPSLAPPPGSEDPEGGPSENASGNASEAPADDPNATGSTDEGSAEAPAEGEVGTDERNGTSGDPLCETVEAAERAIAPYVCQLYTIHGFEPKLTLHPVLGIVEPDPDRCIERLVRPSDTGTNLART